ncbi:MAG: CHAT domain-containing protein [Phormidesmis sp.]
MCRSRKPMKRILALSANPKGTHPLRLDEEIREIDQALRAASLRDEFELHQRWALRPKDLQRALLEVEPTIVHFCGHGEGQAGITLEDRSGQPQFVSTQALARLFDLCAEGIRCVLLNACYAEVQADAIVRSIDYVIGMRQAVPDRVAIAFSTGFYKGLGAGQTIEAAFDSGCEEIRAHSRVSGPDRKAIAVNHEQQPSRSLAHNQIPVLKKRAIA